jgi:hypothetical protein
MKRASIGAISLGLPAFAAKDVDIRDEIELKSGRQFHRDLHRPVVFKPPEFELVHAAALRQPRRADASAMNEGPGDAR